MNVVRPNINEIELKVENENMGGSIKRQEPMERGKLKTILMNLVNNSVNFEQSEVDQRVMNLMHQTVRKVVFDREAEYLAD